jgi:tryptophan synthase alpha chain
VLESYIKQRRRKQQLLLMTHIVIGYPSFDDGLRLVERMVKAGVDLMELQIPFSEPIADGPVILRANQQALERGATVERCLGFAEAVSTRFEVPMLFMSYYNILYKFGVRAFVQRMAEAGLQGAIVPDLPPEEASEYLRAMAEFQLDPIFIFSPNTSEARLKTIAHHASGFVYCVARKGVTGASTSFSEQLEQYLGRCRAATALPLALGFGVTEKADVDFLRGKVDIAVVGSQSLRVLDESGIDSVGAFLEALR